MIEINEKINFLVENALNALDTLSRFSQEEIDKIVCKTAEAGIINSEKLAKLAVEETQRGVLKDKIAKNLFAAKNVWDSIKNLKTVGIINENEFDRVIEIAEPIGVIAGVTPVTNPTSTTIFKILISLKAANPIIFGFHPSAQNCSAKTAKILYDAAVKAGAPENCVQWIESPSIEATTTLMNHPKVALILATGGAAMVRAAYSTGKPALGVGPGNVPCYINKTANLERVCNDILLSKTFDNGMICASEQSVIVDEKISQIFEKIMKVKNCYFLNEFEIEKISDFVIIKEKNVLNPDVVGKTASWIAKRANIAVPENTKILIAKIGGIGLNFPLSYEKLSPILAYYIVKNSDKGIELSKRVLNFGGLGHTAVIHCENKNLVKIFGIQMKAGRILVNSPASQGAIGGLYNTNMPSLTLGCGSYGKNSTTDNISTLNLINRKRICFRTQP